MHPYLLSSRVHTYLPVFYLFDSLSTLQLLPSLSRTTIAKESTTGEQRGEASVEAATMMAM
jgi:hypothetical protein